MKYGKLVNGCIEVSPVKIKVNGRLIISPRAADYRVAGYLPIDVSNEPPEGHKWNNQWEIRDGAIRRMYVEIPEEDQHEMESMVILSGEEAEEYEEYQREIVPVLEEVFG